MIFRLRNRAARIVTGNFDFINVRAQDIMNELGWQTLEQRQNRQLGLNQKSACLFGESRNPSIASNIFVDTRWIKKIIAPPPQVVEGFNKFYMLSVTVLCWQTLDLTQWSMVEMLWIICKCRSSPPKMKIINFLLYCSKHFISLYDKMIQ